MTDRIWAALIAAGAGIITAVIAGIFAVQVAVGSKETQIGDLAERTEELQKVVRYAEAAGGAPVGTIVPFGGPIWEEGLVQQGWLPCDGRAVSRKSYQALFETIGTAWGTGDGVNTFVLPDLRGRFLRGVDSSETSRDPESDSRVASADGGNGGAKVGSLQDDSVGTHNHQVHDPGHAHSVRWGSKIAAGPSVHERANPEKTGQDGAPPLTLAQHTGVTSRQVVYEGPSSNPWFSFTLGWRVPPDLGIRFAARACRAPGR